MDPKNDYDYERAGFDPFFNRSIDNQQSRTLSTDNTPNLEMNYDQRQISGSLGDVLQMGFIRIDGKRGRISIYDEDGNEAVTIGDLDG